MFKKSKSRKGEKVEKLKKIEKIAKGGRKRGQKIWGTREN
jgi:hypothetical protein